MELFLSNTRHNHSGSWNFCEPHWALLPPMLEADHQTTALQSVRTAFKAGRSILRIHCQMKEFLETPSLGDPSLHSFFLVFFLHSSVSLRQSFSLDSWLFLNSPRRPFWIWNSKKSTCFYLLRLRMCTTTPDLFSHSCHEMMGKLRSTRGFDMSSRVRG